jgi:hypothetical protein
MDMSPRAPRVRVTIDRLVLRGFRAEQRDAVASALQAELQRQFADALTLRALGASRSIASLSAKPISMPAAAGPRTIGVQAARRLVRSLRS